MMIKRFIFAGFLSVGVFAVTNSLVYAACTNPTGVEAEIIYNDTHNVMQYCNDTTWIGMGASAPDISSSSLNDLSDVVVTPSDAQVLTWDNANSRWIAADAAGGGWQVPDDAAACALGTDGTIRFNSSKLQVCVNGTGWTDVAGSGVTNGKFVDGTNTANAVFTTGLVGIGTVAPSQNLEVTAGSASVNSIVRISVPSTATADPVLDFLAGGVRGWRVGVDTSDSGHFKIDEGNGALGTTTRMVIEAGGNIGIGTNDPDSRLHVSGGYIKQSGDHQGFGAGLTLENTRSGGNSWVFGEIFDTGKLSIRNVGGSGNKTVMTLLNTGDVGIGTATPGAELEVADSSSDNDVRINLRASSSEVVQLGTSTTQAFIDTYSKPFRLFTNGTSTPTVTVLANGNLGLGTITPTSPLYIYDVQTGNVAAATYYNTVSQLVAQPAGAANSSAYVTQHNHSLLNNNQTVGSARGVYNLAQMNAGATVVNDMMGAYNAVQMDSDNANTLNVGYGAYNAGTLYQGTANFMRGGFNFAQVSDALGGTQTINNELSGSHNLGRNDTTGTVPTAYGSYNYVENLKAGTINNARGGVFAVTNSGGGTIDNAFGLTIDLSNSSGTVTNYYGIHIADDTGNSSGANFAIYTDGSIKSRFGGQVWINEICDETGANCNDVSAGLSGGTASAGIWSATSTGGLDSNVHSTMTDIPGMTTTFTLPSSTTLFLFAEGSLRTDSAVNSQAGIGFVVNGVLQDNSTWGSAIQGLSGNPEHHSTWVISRVVTLGAGTHTIKVQGLPTGDLNMCLEGGGTVQNYKQCRLTVISVGNGTGKFINGTNTADAVFTGGNVGIGTATPGAPLHVKSGNVGLRLETTHATKNTVVGYNGSGAQWSFGTLDSNPDFTIQNAVINGDIRFDTNSGTLSERMVINANGNVGIGTTDPGIVRLMVEGTNTIGIRYARTDAKDARISVGDPTKTWSMATGWSDAGDFSIIEEGVAGDHFYIKQGGNVGIGTATPDTQLHVIGTGTFGDTDTTQGNLVIYGTTATAYSNITTTNGNMHIDAGYGASATGDGMYLNYYSGGNVIVGNPTKRSNLIVHGTSGATCTIGSGTGNTACTSDIRLKDRIVTVTSALDKISQLRGVTFHWKDPSKSETEHLGIIAQEVEAVFPQVVSTMEDETLGEVKLVGMDGLVAPLIEAVKELKGLFDEFALKVTGHGDRIAALEAENAALKDRLDTIEAQLSAE